MFSLQIKLFRSLVDLSIERTVSDYKGELLSLITIWFANQETFQEQFKLISSCEISHASGLHHGISVSLNLLMIPQEENR